MEGRRGVRGVGEQRERERMHKHVCCFVFSEKQKELRGEDLRPEAPPSGYSGHHLQLT